MKKIKKISIFSILLFSSMFLFPIKAEAKAFSRNRITNTANDKGEFENFNVTMVAINKRYGYSYIKGSCPNCDYTPFDLNKETGVSLKYKLYYLN
jgi:hypothetical protein